MQNASDAINELVNWGARFRREKDGRLTQRFFGEHTYRRTVYIVNVVNVISYLDDKHNLNFEPVILSL